MKAIRLGLATVLMSGMFAAFTAAPAAACEPPKSCGSCWVNKDIPERIGDPVDPHRIVWIECHS